MHDYYSSAAGLSAGITQATASLSPGDPLAAQLTALTSDPSHALLGSLFESLVAQSTGSTEMKTLGTALELWTTLTELIEGLRAARAALDAAMVSPTDPNLVDAAAPEVKSLRDTILPGIDDWTKRAADFLKDPSLLGYLPSSGQAADTDPKSWNWHELVTTRRTYALRRGLLKASSGTAGISTALGALSGYATRLSMGSWRNAVVGGPPRNHPLRSRLVARTGGAWLRAHLSGLTPSLSTLRAQVESGVGSSLPNSVADQLGKAIKAAFDPFLPSKTAPNFKSAYRSMLRHLAILDQLRFWVEAPAGQPAVPAISPPIPLPIGILAQVSGSGSGGSGSTAGGQGGIKIQAGSGLGGGPGGANAGAKAYSGKSGAEWWKVLIAVVVTILLTAAGIVGGFFLGGPAGSAGLGSLGLGAGTAFGEWIGAWENNTPDTYAQAQNALSTPEAAAICKALFDLDITLYTAASQFMTVLKGAGLAYPETPDLTTPPFKELLIIQSTETHRAMPTVESFASYPSSPIELSNTGPASSWAFGTGMLPGSAIARGAAERSYTDTATLSLALWRNCLEDDESNAQNHNLESDLGFLMPCWRGKTQPQPISVTLLPYEAV